MARTRTIILVILIFYKAAGFSQDFNTSRGVGIHAGFCYGTVTKDLLIEPGIQIKRGSHLFRLSNEFLLYKGQVLESALALNYRKFPLRNDRRARIFISGEFLYMHTEGYYLQTRRMNGYFLLLGTGMQYGITDHADLGFEVAWGPGYATGSKRFENNTLISRSGFAVTFACTIPGWKHK